MTSSLPSSSSSRQPTAQERQFAGAGAGSGEKRVRRTKKTPFQLEMLEKTYAEGPYPTPVRLAKLSGPLNLSVRQLQMWFCHRRLKDREVESQIDEVQPSAVSALSTTKSILNEPMLGAGTTNSATTTGPPRKVRRRNVLQPSSRIGLAIGKQYDEQHLIVAPAMAQMQLMPSMQQAVASVEFQLGEPLRDDGPVLGIEFDQLPPGAFGAPIVPEHHTKPGRSYGSKAFVSHEQKLTKASPSFPILEESQAPNSYNGRRRKSASQNSHQPHAVSRSLPEYQPLLEQPNTLLESSERSSRSQFYENSLDAPALRNSSSSPGSRYLHGVKEEPFSQPLRRQISGSGIFGGAGQGHSFPSVADHESNQPSNFHLIPTNDFDLDPKSVSDGLLPPSDKMAYHNDNDSHMIRKRKNDELSISKEVGMNGKRIRKDTEKQDVLKKKRDDQMRKNMERYDRERKKEEERMMRERIREEDRLRREQRREQERIEKFLQKQSRKAEKLKQKEELRREKEAEKQKAASDRATARKLAKEYMDLMEDERLELMEIAVHRKGLPSMLCLDSETLMQLDSFRGVLSQFPPKSVSLKHPFAILPWTKSEDNVGNLLMVWKFLYTFSDVLGLWSFTLDEFVQSLHDSDSRLLSEVHVTLLRTIIKDIEDASKASALGIGANMSGIGNPAGGHPQIVEGAYAWGFNIRSWKCYLNFLTWPEVLRQFALSAGFGPQLKKRATENAYYRDENEGHATDDVVSILRDGSAVKTAFAKMKRRGCTQRRKRHLLTPGTVKFAAFHVLSLEGSKGLSILDVAEKIQKHGLRDLSTCKAPEASVGVAMSRDTKLFERVAPCTYCIKSPYRKDPADADAVFAAAREKIRVFQNSLAGSDAEKDADDAEGVEQDDDSVTDDSDDEFDVEDPNSEVKVEIDSILGSMPQDTNVPVANGKNNVEASKDALTNNVPCKLGADLSMPLEAASSYSHLGVSANSSGPTVANIEDTEIDESNYGESWVQGLSEGEYTDLCVEERLNALVSLIGVVTEGNTIRVILEERLEAANTLKKQMWAEAQLDKRRLKEDCSTKTHHNSSYGFKADQQDPSVAEENMTMMHNTDGQDISSNGVVNQQDQFNASNMLVEGNGIQENNANSDSIAAQQYAYAERTRSQLKSYIGHKAEQLYIYRSLPLGQDRRHNRYWLFSTSASPSDPGSGRIFFESNDGCWRLMDSCEAFDSLVAALDARGIRESHLLCMLHRIEPTFKEALKRNSSRVTGNCDNIIKNETTNTPLSMICNNDIDSPSSTLSGPSSHNPLCSISFDIELGIRDAETIGMQKRAEAFIKWIWKRCYSSEMICAMKYGKRRCSMLLEFCQDCYQTYSVEHMHCSSCHKIFKVGNSCDHSLSEHRLFCEERLKADPNLKMQISECYVGLRLRLLKALLAVIEASIPAEALQTFWTDELRKSWGAKLDSTLSAQEFFQMLTLLETAIKPEYLSPNFETTSQLLLSSSSVELATGNSSALLGSIEVLPWVPDTAAAVALRLFDLDEAISYSAERKEEFSKEREDYPSRHASAAKADLPDSSQPNLLKRPRGWLHSTRGRRGGRKSRGGRGSRGRGRYGRLSGETSRTSLAETKVVSTVTKYSQRGAQPRGRGGRRGHRSARSRQIGNGVSRSTTPKEDFLGNFSLLAGPHVTSIEESPRSSGGEEWAAETNVDAADGNGVDSQLEHSDDDGQPLENEYEDRATGNYSRGYADMDQEQVDDDGESEDEDDEVDEVAEDEGAEEEDDDDDDDNDRTGDQSVDAEMDDYDEDDDNVDREDADEGDENASDSSEYSD